MTPEHARLIAALDPPAEWRPSFEAVRRDLFIPDTVWVDGAPVSSTDNPREWLAAVHSDRPIVTQMDDGATAPGERGERSTSSSTMPSIMVTMLDRLHVSPGMRVLEIGTGTGYGTAVLCHRLGDDRVTTVECDPQLRDDARAALARAGYHPAVHRGDGAAGYPPGSPYERVICTAAVTRVPYAWIAQAPGGRIVTPWASDYHNGALLALDVDDDGAASGRFSGNVAFMRIRQQRLHCDVTETGEVAESTTVMDVYDVVGDFDGSFAVGLCLPGVHRTFEEVQDHHVLTLHHPASPSWAQVVVAAGEAFRVTQHGPVRLWDAMEAAHTWWDRAGRPKHTRFGLTVTSRDQWVWLDTPNHRVP